MSLTVLYVCTGNVCRSPMAELLFRAWAHSDSDVEVSSAGTHALVDNGIDFSSASALGQLGIDPSRHRARQYEAWMAADADLVLTAERAHRDLILTELPSALRRTFTMKEFARLVAHVDPGAPLDVIAATAQVRGIDAAVPDDEDNMPDPYRDAVSKARTIAQQITDCVRTTIDALGLNAPSEVAASVPVPAPVAEPDPAPAPAPRRPMPRRADS